MSRSKAAKVTQVQHSWAIPGLFKGADPNRVAGELAALQERTGGVTSEQVLAYAEDPSTELHKCFEWDDSKAARLYRLKQARTIVTTLRIEYRQGGRFEVKRVNYHVALPQREYVSRDVLLLDKGRARQVKQQAWKDLEHWLERYTEIDELCPDASASVLKAIEALRSAH